MNAVWEMAIFAPDVENLMIELSSLAELPGTKERFALIALFLSVMSAANTVRRLAVRLVCESV